MLPRTRPGKKREAGDGRARRALLGYSPPGGAGARRAAGGVRGRGPRASPPAGPAAAAAAASSGSRPWPPAPGAWPSRSAPRPGPARRLGGGGAAATPARGQTRAPAPASPGRAPRAPGARSPDPSWPRYLQLPPETTGTRARPRWRRGRGAGTGRTRAGEESRAGWERERREASGAGAGRQGRGLDTNPEWGGRPLAPRHPRRRAPGRLALDVPPVRCRPGRRGSCLEKRLPGSLRELRALEGGAISAPLPGPSRSSPNASTPPSVFPLMRASPL